MSKTRNIAKSSSIIAIMLIISKVTGTLRELLIAIQFGQNIQSDIFKIATRIPQLFLSCVAAALVTTFIPVFSEFKDDREKANEFFNNVLNIVIVICSLLAIIGILFSSQLTSLFVSGFASKYFIQTSNMTKIVMPVIVFLAMSGLYTGYLQSYGVFLQPALTGIVANFVIIIGIIVFGKIYGITAAVVAFVIGSIAQVFIQTPFMGEYKYRFYINLKDDNVKKMFLLSVPMLISSAVAQVNVIVDSTFASNLIAGSISVVDNASKLTTIINQAFIVSITTVFYPLLTEKFSKNDKVGFEDTFTKSVNLVIILAIPLILGMMVLSTPLVKLLLEHGKFTAQDTLKTSLCIKYLAFSALGYSMVDILGKVFFATKDTLTPMITGLIMIGINILMIFILVPRLGVNGLALANTVSSCTISVVMIIIIRLRLKDIKYKEIGITSIKVLFSAAVMTIFVKLTYNFINVIMIKNSLIFLAIKIILPTGIGVILYGFLLYILKVKELVIIAGNKIKVN